MGWEGLGASSTAQAGPQPPPRLPGTLPTPRVTLNKLLFGLSFFSCVAPVSFLRGFKPLAKLPARRQCRRPLPGPRAASAPPPQDSRQRSRAGPAGGAPALLTHRSPKRRARAQPGTPRHVTARAGATREAGPARGTGVGREVVPAREGPSRHWPTSPGCRPRPQPHSSPGPHAPQVGDAHRPNLPRAARPRSVGIASRFRSRRLPGQTRWGGGVGVPRLPAPPGAGTVPAPTPRGSGPGPCGPSPSPVSLRPPALCCGPYEWPPARAGGARGRAGAAPVPPPPRSPWPPGRVRSEGRARAATWGSAAAVPIGPPVRPTGRSARDDWPALGRRSK